MDDDNDDDDDLPFLSKVEAEDAFFFTLKVILPGPRSKIKLVVCHLFLDREAARRSFFLILNYCDFGGRDGSQRSNAIYVSNIYSNR